MRGAVASSRRHLRATLEVPLLIDELANIDVADFSPEHQHHFQSEYFRRRGSARRAGGRYGSDQRIIVRHGSRRRSQPTDTLQS